MFPAKILSELAALTDVDRMTPDAIPLQAVRVAVRCVRPCSGGAAALWRNGVLGRYSVSHGALAGLFGTGAHHGDGDEPVIEAIRTRTPVLVNDTHTDRRWPDFGRAAAACGLRAVLVVPVAADDDRTLTLNLYSVQPCALDDEQVLGTARAIAEFTAVALANAERHEELSSRCENLRTAMASRGEIERAKGIVMHALECDADTAFGRLREISQREGVKLAQVARDILAHYGIQTRVSAPV